MFNPFKKPIINFTMGIVTVVIILALYWWYALYHPSTDDAYVEANIIAVQAQVNGKIKKIYITDNQFVDKGKLLLEIDPYPFQVALKKAQSDLTIALQNVEAKKKEILSTKAVMEQRQAVLDFQEKNVARYRILFSKKQISAEQLEQAESNYKVALAGLAAAKNNHEEAIVALGDPTQDNAFITQARTAVNAAKINLGYTKIYAPQSGNVSNFDLREGSIVNIGRQLFAFIENNEWWVQANFKETDISRLAPGQKAKIILDLYPHHTFKGKVESISRGSGATFSLLPAENASGNWVKVTQRFPVRIKLINSNKKFPFRVGASASVTVSVLEKIE